MRVVPMRAVLALVLLAALAVAASPAQAAFPGGNGKIAFVCNQTPLNDDICVIEPDGTGLQNISNTPDFGAGSFVEGAPEWSADGAKIAFRRGGGAQGIYVMDSDGANVVQLTSGPDSEPTWSPDGLWIAFNRDGDIWKVPSSGVGAPVKLTNRIGFFPAFGGPSWKPDGTRIALHRVTGFGFGEIYTMKPDGSDMTPVTANGGENRYPNWSPDGDRIAFDCTPPRDICVIDADGTDEDNLTENAAEQNEFPAWSPDGEKIVFSSPVPRPPDVGADFELYTMDQDGSAEQPLTANALNDRLPDWQPVGPGPPETLTLEPSTDTNIAGEQHCVTATVKDGSGNPTPDVTVRFSVGGANSASGSDTTDSNGEAGFCYTGTTAGADTIGAFADVDGDGSDDGTSEPDDTAAKTYVAGAPASLALAPATSSNTVDSQHCVTATVEDAFGNPTPGVAVRFKVTGANPTTGSATTDTNGEAGFCYTGALQGEDAIAAFADTDESGDQDPGEPSDEATKTWVVPPSTEGCKVTNDGRITTTGGDEATFSGKAQVKRRVKGEETYEDHGPATPLKVESAEILAVTCDGSGTQASIFGTAQVDGQGSFGFRIDVADNGEPGSNDTYRIRVSNGYDSGERTLEEGNAQISE